jgi:hypothetical protein
MTKPTKAADFLQNMAPELAATERTDANGKVAQDPRRKPAATRSGLKHIGGYLDMETVEKVAILRARLSLDNSELIKLAVDNLHSKHMAKRGDP